ncbi:MAG: DUF4058 family protein [Planctomycetota bacterium]
MRCPFPGMDPYLEQPSFWGDFTAAMLIEIRSLLNPRLLPEYETLVEEYVIVTHEDVRLHRLRPDVTISATPDWLPGSLQSGAVSFADVAVAELDYPDLEPITQRCLKIIHRKRRRVVTVMEVLSPSNKKPGEDGIETYLAKRAEYLGSDAHLVEIDLLRGGERLPMRRALPPGDYYVYVGRQGRVPRGQVFGWNWKSRLPTISIPLLKQDPEVELNLQEVFESVYEPACYDRMLPYDEPVEPPLPPADEAWTRERLQAAGLFK